MFVEYDARISPAVKIGMFAFRTAVSDISRPMDFCSLTMRRWKGGRCSIAAIRRMSRES